MRGYDNISRTLRLSLPAAKGLDQIDISIFRGAYQLPQKGRGTGSMAPTKLINAPRKPQELVLL